MNAKTRIKHLFSRLQRAAIERECDILMLRAFDAALTGERAHRRIAPGRYRCSIRTAAQYFVVKWYLEHDSRYPRPLLYWATIRPDCMYASALREALADDDPLAGETLDVDYVEHIAPIR